MHSDMRPSSAPPSGMQPGSEKGGRARFPGVMSVDVEDYFQVEAFSAVIPKDSWDQFPSRVEDNTLHLLDLLDECRTEATFFVLGWVAERFPGLVRRIAARGHEVGCHSYWHRLIYTLAPAEFRADTIRAKAAIEQALGDRIGGYRAPSYSITARSTWAIEILAEAGFHYDSSMFPVRHDIYGVPSMRRLPFAVETSHGQVLELPLTTFRLAGERNWPVGGGGYLRILPFWYSRLGLARAHREGIPVISYIHPWEIDPEQPRVPNAPWRSRFRHYTNLAGTATRLRTLLSLGEFVSFRRSGLLEAKWPTIGAADIAGTVPDLRATVSSVDVTSAPAGSRAGKQPH